MSRNFYGITAVTKDSASIRDIRRFTALTLKPALLWNLDMTSLILAARYTKVSWEIISRNSNTGCNGRGHKLRHLARSIKTILQIAIVAKIWTVRDCSSNYLQETFGNLKYVFILLYRWRDPFHIISKYE